MNPVLFRVLDWIVGIAMVLGVAIVLTRFLCYLGVESWYRITQHWLDRQSDLESGEDKL